MYLKVKVSARKSMLVYEGNLTQLKKSSKNKMKYLTPIWAIGKGSVALTERRRKNGDCLFFRQPTDKIVSPVTTLRHRDDKIVLCVSCALTQCRPISFARAEMS